MNKMLPDGKKVFASIIAGKDTKINGMYVIYGTQEMHAAPNADFNYLEELSKSKDCGIARLHITGAVPNDDGSVTFTSLLTAGNTEGGEIKADTKVLAVVLAWMPDGNRVHDKLVYSSVMKNPVPFLKEAYVTISVTMTVGE